MSHDGVGPRAVMRSVAFLTAGVLAVPALAGCSEKDPAGKPTAGQEIAPAERGLIADGGTLRWAVDAVPETLNAFQADADAATSKVAGAVLPSMYRLDANGRPQRNPDYLESAKIVDREPRQVVLYKLNQQAVWSDGREIGAADFAAQWRALSGKDTAYWTARNAGYDRIEKIERGANDLEVRVTFSKPYADWQSLFSPLYPKEVMGTPDAFNDGARRKLKVTAGPFALDTVDKDSGEVRLKRNPRWWGRPAKLSELVLRAVPRDKRTAALAEGKVDLAEIDSSEAHRITLAARDKGKGNGAPLAHGPGAALTPGKSLRSWAIAHGSDEEAADEEILARKKRGKAVAKYADEQSSLRGFEVRKSLEPAFTQLALNGEQGPLADERVRRAVARALDREELARVVLRPLGLPAEPVGSHLALSGQHAYADNSGALGGQDTKEAQALLADAGWVSGGPVKEEQKEKKAAGAGASKEPAGSEASKASGTPADSDTNSDTDTDTDEGSGSSEDSGSSGSSSTSDSAGSSDSSSSSSSSESSGDDGTYIVGEDGKPGDDKPGENRAPALLVPAPLTELQRVALLDQAYVLGVRGQAEKAKKAKKQKAGKKQRIGKKQKAETEKNQKMDGPGTSGKVEKNLAREGQSQFQHGGAPGAYAPKGTAAPGRAAAGPLAKNGKPLSLRFVLPSGPGSQSLRAVGERIARMLERIGIRTEISKVADESYFKDHIASGQYDLALYSWPASAFPATDARPIYSKPVPAADGSLNVEQNYTRVGTDQVDQLFDQAIAELDPGESRSLVRKADARIWAAAGSIPLYQRPQLTAARTNLANAGAFGFQTPLYEDMGFLKKGTKPQTSSAP
ncbi:ABC transporter family substrate-binding protein [Streptomyces sp. ActVer]|uniref:ABC transporter family substrate-binding protein n=1 Tax=Streptomyces sp. ActVer TaxID=3014558 RepID=UPI0022B2B02C|nr:ABC transporter family substrate-binding protein [Streptomyces sp. ActVer]MCZ4508147.1 ABC transporter family substrate-binding protein [Streptomyces sp. ActVer]